MVSDFVYLNTEGEFEKQGKLEVVMSRASPFIRASAPGSRKVNVSLSRISATQQNHAEINPNNRGALFRHHGLFPE
jgi:hypothetical protein